jgi:hypothetical protein
MASSVWPTIEALLNGHLQPPEPLHLLLANVLALGLTILLNDLAARPPDRRWVPLGIIDLPGSTSLDRILPSTLYLRVADVEAGHIRKARDPQRLKAPFAEWDTTVVRGLDVITIQLAHFAGPVVLAESVGVSSGLAVAIGTVFWALPARYSQLPGRLVLGASFAWLWLTGGGWLALGSHLGLYLSLNLVRRSTEWLRIRNRQRWRNRQSELTD